MSQLSTFDALKHVQPTDKVFIIEGELLKELQDVLLDMLRDVITVCEENDIEYMVGGGTCLGAIRHHGFIPWDDDLDLSMTRSDYERFAPIFLNRFCDKYVLQTIYVSDNYELGFPRIRKRGTTLICRDDFVVDDECGVYIDVFLIDNTFDNGALRFFHGFISLAIGFAYSCRRFSAHRDDYIDLAGKDKKLVRVFITKAMIGRLLSFMSTNAWCRLWDAWNGLVTDDTTKWTTVPVGRKHFFGELQKRSSLFPTKTSRFESLVVRTPLDTDIYLTKLFGSDYMIEPPVECREAHVVYQIDLGN